MSNFAQFVQNVGSFNSGVLLPFIEEFFTSTVGFCFVAVTTIVVVLIGLKRLLK